ncbi:hypothetical protein V6N13_148228 [Hibiscus sabdariffa]
MVALSLAVKWSDPQMLSTKRIMHFRMLFEAIFECHDKVAKKALNNTERFGFLFEKTGGRSLEASLPDGPRLFLRNPYQGKGQSLTLMKAVFEDSARSTESYVLSLFFPGFSFSFCHLQNPLFPG